MFDNNAEKVNLSGEATRSTMGSIASGLGWLALLVLALATAGHAVSITMAWANLNPAGGDLVAILALIGVALVEVFAVLIAVMYATHSLRAKQKPVAMMVEAAWFVFAAVNLISSFSMKHGGEIPTFVGSWVTYGLPVAGLIVGGLFYVVMRLDPNAARADDVAELDEGFERVKHNAKIEVLASPQMRAVIRQMTWQQLPPIIGRQMNLSENQIAALTGQAPQLLDLNGNGVPDIQEAQPAPVQSGDVDIAAALALLAANPHLLSLVRPVDSMSNSTHARNRPRTPRRGRGGQRRQRCAGEAVERRGRHAPPLVAPAVVEAARASAGRDEGAARVEAPARATTESQPLVASLLPLVATRLLPLRRRICPLPKKPILI
jgi:hypothetical protein